MAHATAGITIAVIDTGADLAAPDLAAKTPLSYNVRALGAAVSDPNGHGTFVASLAAGSSSNGDGIAGSSGDARLMVIEAADRHGSFTDVDEAAAIVYAVDHGARIINLSLGGPTTSSTERRAVDYAVSKGALPGRGDRQQPSRRESGRVSGCAPAARRLARRRRTRLSVGASTKSGATRVVFQHRARTSPSQRPATPSSAPSPPPPPSRAIRGSASRARPQGSTATPAASSFAAPQVAGAAALVWAANPRLRAKEVAAILKRDSLRRGTWSLAARLRRPRRRARAVAQAQNTRPARRALRPRRASI